MPANIATTQPECHQVSQLSDLYNNKLFISKMVSQVCTITNNSPETIGSVTGFSGYTPLLTFIDF